MKTIITSSGESMTSEFDLRFGRAAYFCVLDEESGKTEFFHNEDQNAEMGAGTKAAEKALEWGVQKVISGDFGPKAKEVLERFNVQMVIMTDSSAKVEDVVKLLQGQAKTKTMKKRIAIPVQDGMLNEHFGHCSHLVFFDVDENDQIINESIVDAPPHQPGLLPPWLAERGVTDVIAGGMGQRAIQLFKQNGVNVFVGAPKIRAKELLEGFVSNELAFSANYCDH